MIYMDTTTLYLIGVCERIDWKKKSTAGIDKEKKNPKSLDYDLSNTTYN